MRGSLFIACLLMFGLTGHANAEKGDQYWMAKAGLSFFDKSQDEPDSLQAINFTYGYGLTKAIAAEVDYQQSVGGGAYKRSDNTEEGEFAYKLFSVGAAYRHVFYESLYFRGKLAFAFGDEERTSSLVATETSDVTNFSGALALGFLAGDVIGSSLTLELEYIQHSSALSSVLLGANVTF